MASAAVEPFTRLSADVWLTRVMGGTPLNIGLVVGPERAVLVDPGPADADGAVYAGLLQRVREITDSELIVVNTHGHADHTGANAYLRQNGAVAVWAHENAGVEEATDLVGDEPATLELGNGLTVVLEHLGRGHTDGDLVAGVVREDRSGKGVLFCGDLVREGTDPRFRDSYPKEWVRTLGKIWSMSGTYAKFVPGHGRPVDSEFVASMRRRMQQGHNVSSQAIRDSVADATKAIPILPYGPDESRELITRLRGDSA